MYFPYVYKVGCVNLYALYIVPGGRTIQEQSLCTGKTLFLVLCELQHSAIAALKCFSTVGNISAWSFYTEMCSHKLSDDVTIASAYLCIYKSHRDVPTTTIRYLHIMYLSSNPNHYTRSPKPLFQRCFKYVCSTKVNHIQSLDAISLLEWNSSLYGCFFLFYVYFFGENDLNWYEL